MVGTGALDLDFVARFSPNETRALGPARVLSVGEVGSGIDDNVRACGPALG